jgi:hypothetical protein
MASRYSNTNNINDTSGKRRQRTTIIPVPPVSSNDVYIQTTSIERLDLLAYKFYGDESLWYIIASANSLGKGSLVVPTNSLLRIPDITDIQTQIQTVNITR